MAHINVGPTKAVGVGPTARREREVEAMHQAIRSGQISTKYPDGAVVTIFDPPPPDFDPLTADPTQLWRHGFPPRPSDPAALRQWGALLGTPLRFVTPTITRRPALRRRLPEFYGHESTDIWSGAVVFASTPATLFTVTGQWKVPHIKPFSNGDDRYVGVWVGIDGDRSGDVLQAGIAAEMSSGDDQPDLWAWFEWFPDDSNELDVPVAVGDSMSCVVTADQDCLPRSAVQHGQWKTIDDDHTLVPMHDGKILDWVPDDGTWRLWHYDPTKANILTAEVSHGQWSSVGDGHVLVPMHDGKILDWVPDSGHWRLWRYDPTKANILAGEVSHGQWSSVGDGHVLVPMIDGNVIDWVPDDGTWRLWKYDPTNTQDCLPANAVSAGRWTSLDDDHTLLPMHDGRVLDWTGDGTWRLWNYDAEGRSMVSGTIVLRNETQRLQSHMRLQAPDNTLLIGSSAEWIVERPFSNDVSSGWPLLADYGTVQFTHAHAESTGGAIMKPSDGDTINMETSHGKTESTGTAAGETVTCKFV